MQATTGPEQRAGATQWKRGDELVAGDILYFLGTPRRITHFDDYSDNPWGYEGWRIARAGGPRWEGDKGWGMTIDPDSRYWVS